MNYFDLNGHTAGLKTPLDYCIIALGDCGELFRCSHLFFPSKLLPKMKQRCVQSHPKNDIFPFLILFLTHTAKNFKYNNFSITCQIEFTGWLGFPCVNLTGCLLFCLHNDSLCFSPIFAFCSSDVATSNTSKLNCWINTSSHCEIYTLQLCWGGGIL